MRRSLTITIGLKHRKIHIMKLIARKIISVVLVIQISTLISEPNEDYLDRIRKVEEIFEEIPPLKYLEFLIAQQKQQLLEEIVAIAEIRKSKNDNQDSKPPTHEHKDSTPPKEEKKVQPRSYFPIIEPSDEIAGDPIEIIQDYYQDQEFPPAFLAALKYLQDPEKFLNDDKPICNTFLFAGPPGCGKTYLAELIQNVFGLPMVSVSAGQLHNKYIGVGAEKVTKLFSLRDPKDRILIIFIDEIDGMANRFSDDSHPEQRNTLNELLVQMQKNADNPYIFIIAATNHKEMLDPALLSRFEGRLIEFSAMTQKDREKFIYQELPDNCLDKTAIAKKLAQITDGLSRRVIARIIKDVDMYSFSQVDKGQNYILKLEDFTKQINHIKKEHKLPARTTIKHFIRNNITYLNFSLSVLAFLGFDRLVRNQLSDVPYWIHYLYSKCNEVPASNNNIIL